MTVRAAIVAFACSLSAAAYAMADVPKPVNVEAGDLVEALESLAKQCGVDVIYPSRQIRGLKTRGVSGMLETQEAFQKLIEGTSLVFQQESGAVLITLPRSSAGAFAPPAEQGGSEPSEPASLWSRFHLAQADEATTTGAPSAGNPDSALAVEEIVVTAQKRIERLQDVPVPVTAINANTLMDSNQLQIQEYYTRIPGLSVTLGGDGAAPQLTIRGITTGGFSNPTVGIVIDDMSYGSSTSQGNGYTAPDIDPSDLARVEVLRGPQGTLYGASSIGGLLNYVTVDPSTDAFRGRVQAGLTSIHNGDDMGYTVRGAVNVPLSDTWAVRASGFTRQDPGYIDDPVRNVEGINRNDAAGGRLSALWEPSDIFSVKLSALLQDLERKGSSETYVQPGLGDLEQNALPGTGAYENRIQAYSVNVAAKLGDADLTSVTGYSVNTITTHLDATPVLSDVTSLVFPGVTGAPDPVDNETEKFTEELRVSIPLGERFEWLVGAFYTHEDVSSHQAIQAADANTGTVIATTYDFTAPYTFAEYAAFTDVTVHFTDRFDVQVGGRQSHNRQTYSSQATGPFVPIFYGVPSPLVTPEVESSESAFTYLVTPRLRITPELMLYARLASGYRPGGPTPNATALGLPPQYDADKTQNYEIGLKGDAFDQALTFDASLYYIDWKDIQVQLRDPVNFTSYLANGSRARSRGAELSVESRPRTGLTLSGWVSWNDAELTEDFPAGSTAVGTKGARLPYSGRFSGNVSVDQDFAIANNVIAFAGASLSYVGERQGIFASIFAPSPQRQVFPSYTKTDVRAGVRYDTWTFNVFVNNLTDRRGVLTGGLDNLIVPFAFNYIQPRTAGLSLTKTL